MTLAAAFQSAFGRPPAGVWSAPGRVNLIGEHTDYNGGLALPIGLSKRTYAAAAPRDDARLRVASLQAEGVVEMALADIGPGRIEGWAAYVLGVAWALREAGLPVGGADILLDGQVPLGAGLSSSAAIECAAGAALSDLYDLGLLADDGARARLAALARRAENEVAGAPTGGMDQAAAMLAQEGRALLLDCRDGHTEQVAFEIGAAGLCLLVIDTKAHHALVDGQYGARRASCERAAGALGIATLREIDPAGLEKALTELVDRLDTDGEPVEVVQRRVRHVVTEIDRVRQCAAALRAGDWGEAGRLFAQSHASLRDDFEVSCAELDLACETAQAHGALGARMTGGGFGGSAIALVPADRADAVADAVIAAFAAAGFTAPEPFAVMPSPSARRED